MEIYVLGVLELKKRKKQLFVFIVRRHNNV